mgnify:CR=1 FL=1
MAWHRNDIERLKKLYKLGFSLTGIAWQLNKPREEVRRKILRLAVRGELPKPIKEKTPPGRDTGWFYREEKLIVKSVLEDCCKLFGLKVNISMADTHLWEEDVLRAAKMLKEKLERLDIR